MEPRLLRAYVVELIGAFVLVFFSAGVVCVNHMTTPLGQQPATASLTGHQPGLIGVALTQGLVLALVLAATLPVSGGYVNPALTVMLWVFNRLDSVRAVWLIGAQFLGAVLAGLCLQYTFEAEVLRGAHLGTPHLSSLVYPTVSRAALVSGTGLELMLTFLLVLAIFSAAADGFRTRPAAWSAGAATLAAVVVGFPLTGAALNPARWFGTALWELGLEASGPARGPMADAFVYVAGPIVGALLAGLVCFKLLRSEPPPEPQTKSADHGRPAGTHVKAKK